MTDGPCSAWNGEGDVSGLFPAAYLTGGASARLIRQSSLQTFSNRPPELIEEGMRRLASVLTAQ
jgi:hypothetical protein